MPIIAACAARQTIRPDSGISSKLPSPAEPGWLIVRVANSTRSAAMTQVANGPFEVKLNPESLSPVAEQTGLGRMSLDKQYHGDLEAVSHGEMLAFRSSIQLRRLCGDGNRARCAGRPPRQLCPAAQLHHDARTAAAVDHRRARFRHGRIAGARRLDDHHHRQRPAFVPLRLHVAGIASVSGLMQWMRLLRDAAVPGQ